MGSVAASLKVKTLNVSPYYNRSEFLPDTHDFHMKKYFTIVLSVLMLISVSCVKDDLSWKEELASIKSEIENIKSLLTKLQSRVTVINVNEDENGYTIVFSDGKTITVKNAPLPCIVKVVETSDSFIFYFYDGSSIECPKYSALVYMIRDDSTTNRTQVFIPHFTESSQLLWMFEQNLINNLMTPMGCREVPNGSLNYLDGKSIISQGGTDWISPYVVFASNNEDGDFPKGTTSYFSGGCHGYKQLSTGVTPSARCIDYKSYVDGKVIGKGSSLYGKEIKLVWKNLIQASNTMKEDGNGREVIEEIVTCIITGKKDIDFIIETIALEDVEICNHYGLQSINASFKGKVIYKGSKTSEYGFDEISHANCADCKSISFKNDEYEFTVSTNDDFEYNRLKKGQYNVFYTNVKKSYFCAILAPKSDPVILKKGESIVFEGSYAVTKN